MVLFSIIIPTYNRAAFIRKAIDSVLAQRYKDWELIVVDDASTDDTLEILSHYKDDRIRIIRHAINQERSTSRNKGIAAAQGEYICFLDSDDYYFPEHLDVLHEYILANHYPVALLHTDVSVRDTNGIEIRSVHYTYAPNLPLVELVLTNHIQPNTVAIHRSILERFQFDPSLAVNEDVYLFAQIAMVFPVLSLPQTTVAWVLHDSNTTRLLKNHVLPQLHATQKIFRDSGINISAAFKRKKYFELYSQLVYFYASNKKPILSMCYFVRGLLVKPFHKQHKTNLLNVVYHLPGGQLLKKSVQLFKRN
jgi:glycosyltransferase involved in cell wall biosynthesis